MRRLVAEDRSAWTREQWVAFVEVRTTPEPNSGCWLWTGALTGYPQVLVSRGLSQPIGRVLLGMRKGDRSRVACHRCDVPACANPAHIYDGTASTNSRDAVRRGRMRHSDARVSMETVRRLKAEIDAAIEREARRQLTKGAIP